MPPPKGAGACWYWPAKLYSPIVRRICSSIASDSRSGCSASPRRRVQAVHDQDDRHVLLVVEAAVEGVVEPLVGRLAMGPRQRLLALQRVVDDDDVRTPSGQHPADRARDPAALRRRFELGHRLMPRREPGREDSASLLGYGRYRKFGIGMTAHAQKPAASKGRARRLVLPCKPAIGGGPALNTSPADEWLTPSVDH